MDRNSDFSKRHFLGFIKKFFLLGKNSKLFQKQYITLQSNKDYQLLRNL
jgi:hypothetical protein